MPVIRSRNESLAAWMAEHRVTALELAERVNDELANLTGRRGDLSERTVFRWLSGEASWPWARNRAALRAVTGRTDAQLGLVCRRSSPPATAPPEDGDDVRRRTFITVTAGTALATSTTAHATRRVGMSDVHRLNARLAELVASDDRHGGTVATEQRAVELARQTLGLQQNAVASERVRAHLYAAAASFTSSAMWAAIDGGRLGSAQRHLHQAVTLAGLSGDSSVQVRVWGHAGALYRQLRRPADAKAAHEAARAAGINRRDPFYASLTHARLGATHAELGDATAALRSLGHAQQSLDRADLDRARPAWTRFYDQAELEGLALMSSLALCRWPEAEAHAHRCLALLHPRLVRNRAVTLVDLALAQLRQGDVEPAVLSAQAVPLDLVRHGGRVRHRLDAFGEQLRGAAAGTAEAQAWAEHARGYRTSML